MGRVSKERLLNAYLALIDVAVAGWATFASVRLGCMSLICGPPMTALDLPSLSNDLAFVKCPHNDSEQVGKQSRNTVSEIVGRDATQSAALQTRATQSAQA
jgi:hypothetical protein